MILKTILPLFVAALSLFAAADFSNAQEITSTLLLKTPGNTAVEYLLVGRDGVLQAEE